MQVHHGKISCQRIVTSSTSEDIKGTFLLHFKKRQLPDIFPQTNWKSNRPVARFVTLVDPFLHLTKKKTFFFSVHAELSVTQKQPGIVSSPHQPVTTG